MSVNTHLPTAALAPVLAAWDLDAAGCSIEAAADGNINDTFFVAATPRRRYASNIPSQGNGRYGHDRWTYVLQRINSDVFPDPVAVIENQRLVIRHAADHDTDQVVPLLPTPAGELSYCDAEGAIWRLQPFQSASRTLSALGSDDDAHAAGRAFGRFQAVLADLPAMQLHAPIPHFHDLCWHFEQFDALVGGGGETPEQAQRLGAVVDECRFVAARRHLCEIAQRGPTGVIHGDCKVSNLLFASDEPRVLAVIDLDTVMVGNRSWDFGDLVRSVASGTEDVPPEPLSMDSYRALATGFIDGLSTGSGNGDISHTQLRQGMVDAPAYMTFMLGLRFLLDHLDGDRYFRVRKPSHNLMRARAQFALVARLERARAAMARVIRLI